MSLLLSVSVKLSANPVRCTFSLLLAALHNVWRCPCQYMLPVSRHLHSLVAEGVCVLCSAMTWVGMEAAWAVEWGAWAAAWVAWAAERM